MKYTDAVWFVAIPFLAACSDNNLTAPTAATLASLIPAASHSADHERPFGGRCDTEFTISPPLAGDAPNVRRFHIAYVCQLQHLGRTTAVAEQIVVLGAPLSTASNTTVYTAANGDQLFVSWTGTASGSPNATFSGPETITGGTGRFAGATGSTWLSGTASFATMTGQFTSVGTISY
jgi:hypothetical protein